jgi:hypothetical protein
MRLMNTCVRLKRKKKKKPRKRRLLRNSQYRPLIRTVEVFLVYQLVNVYWSLFFRLLNIQSLCQVNIFLYELDDSTPTLWFSAIVSVFWMWFCIDVASWEWLNSAFLLGLLLEIQKQVGSMYKCNVFSFSDVFKWRQFGWIKTKSI